jgi:hypothetical protein
VSNFYVDAKTKDYVTMRYRTNMHHGRMRSEWYQEKGDETCQVNEPNLCYLCSRRGEVSGSMERLLKFRARIRRKQDWKGKFFGVH